MGGTAGFPATPRCRSDLLLPLIFLVFDRFLLDLLATAFDVLARALDGVASRKQRKGHGKRYGYHQRYQTFHDGSPFIRRRSLWGLQLRALCISPHTTCQPTSIMNSMGCHPVAHKA